MYDLNHIIVIIFNCIRAYAQGYTLVNNWKLGFMLKPKSLFRPPIKKHD